MTEFDICEVYQNTLFFCVARPKGVRVYLLENNGQIDWEDNVPLARASLFLTRANSSMTPTSLACSYTEPHLAVGSQDGAVRVHSIPQGKLISTLYRPLTTSPRPVETIFYQPTKKQTLLVSDRLHHTLYDIEKEKFLVEWEISSPVQNLTFSMKTPQTFVSIDEDSFLNLYDVRKQKIGLYTAQTSDQLKSIDIHPNGTEIAILTPLHVLKLDIRNLNAPVTKIPTKQTTPNAKVLKYQQPNPFPAQYQYKHELSAVDKHWKQEKELLKAQDEAKFRLAPKGWNLPPKTVCQPKNDSEFPSLG